MESMEEDGFSARDDHNHNYCAPGGGDVHSHTDVGKRQLTDGPSPFPQPVPYLPVRGPHREGQGQEGTRDKLYYPKATIASQLMDSDSSSEGSEVCESSDSPASSAAGSDITTTNSTSKFRKFP